MDKMSIDPMREVVENIQKAVGFSLYDHQIDYILGTGELMQGRRTGKTVAYCIKLALSDGEPLDLTKPEWFADERSLPDHKRYARYFFIDEFMKYRHRLAHYGFAVRRVKH